MSKIHVSNLSGTNIYAGAVVLPPGGFEVENTSEFRATWNDGTNMTIDPGKSYHVATFGANPTVELLDTTEGNYTNLMLGFSLVFCIGLTALGARWVGRVMKGGINE